jgi:hypothetical protein
MSAGDQKVRGNESVSMVHLPELLNAVQPLPTGGIKTVRKSDASAQRPF